jgi:methionyl-tRNA formyltransferase
MQTMVEGTASSAPQPGKRSRNAGLPSTLIKIWKAEVAEKSGEAGAVLSADKNGILVACGEGALRIWELQREGGRRMNATEFLAGHPLKAGEKFMM